MYEEKLNKLKKEYDQKAEKFDKKVKTSSFYKNKIKELENQIVALEEHKT